MQQVPEDRIDRIIDDIYEAATDETLWPGIIRQIAEFSGGFGGGLNLWDTAHQTFPAYYQSGFSEEYCKALGEHYLKFDPRPHAMLNQPNLRLYTDALLIPDEVKRRHEYFDWERKNADSRFGYGARLIKTGRFESMLVLARLNSQGAATAADLERLDVFVPHLRRSITMAQRMGERLTRQAVDSLPFGVAIMDETGRVAIANRALLAMSAKNDGLTLSSTGITLAGLGENESLRQLIHLHRTRSYATLAQQRGGVSASRPSGARPYAILVHPLRNTSVTAQGLGNAVMICVSDPEEALATTTARLEDLFSLTPAEAALCAALVKDGTLADAARRCGLTDGSARQYLKRVFAKTNTRGQVELVALILGSIRA
jgi:DNA-binding CsgD family transcriptional regulator